MKDRTLLWVDLTLQRAVASSTKLFEELFTVRRNSANSLTDVERPDALCFDFDFPDQPGLRLLEKAKCLHPSVPILMLTVQHSEELAVWALRAQVWDYFVKPISRRDVERCYESLSKIDPTEANRRPIWKNPPLPTASRLRRFGSVDQQLLAPGIAFVEAHYSDKITESQVAGLCAMSTFQFSRAFHAVFGRTFQNYLLGFRLARAEELLLNPAVSITDVGYAVGFRDASYFGRAFRKRRKMSPTQWRHHRSCDEQPYLRVAAPD